VQDDHLIRMMRARIAATPHGVAMRHKVGTAWRPITYGELGKRIDAVATWLIRAGVARGNRVVIFADNSPWWSIADLAIMTAGAVPVPIYATDTAPQAIHIVRDADARVAFVGNEEQYRALALLRGPGGQLDKIVAFDHSVALNGDDSCHFDALLGETDSKVLAERLERSAIDDIATIIYTSGTTGEPKGVVLTYANLQSQFAAVDAFFRVTEHDRSLCFLPLSHAYERTWTFYVLLKGAQNYYLDNPKAVIETMREVRPTCMVSVPRLYEKIYATARHRVDRAPAAKKALFEWAVRTGGQVARARKAGERAGPLLATQFALADRLVLRKIRDIVGGPKNFFSSGGAALSAEIEEFFLAVGLLICQGYGLTETSPMATCNRPGDFKFGTVGKAIPGCEVRIAPDGEILLRGTNVTQGYFGRPQDTADAFEDGWFKTGDVGEIDADGFLRITDRKKDIIITSQGKNVAPSRIESVIGKDYYIDQVAAVGEGRTYLAALIVPHFEALEEWAREHGLTYDSIKALVRDSRVHALFAERIALQQAVLAKHEQVKRFAVLSEHFSQGGGEITPTLKNIRRAIAKKYEQVINSIYSGHSGGSPDDSPGDGV
jgi:long-chain acyl-CoA synthetase